MADSNSASKVKGKALIKDLGVMIGLLTPDSGGEKDQFSFNEDWIKDPIGNLAKVPTNKDQRAALVKTLDDAWGERIAESPLLIVSTDDNSVTADETKWLPIPKKKPKPETKNETENAESAPEVGQTKDGEAAENAGEDEEAGGETEDKPSNDSGLYLIPESKDADAEFSLGLRHEFSTTDGNYSLTPFAQFPLAALPFPDGNPMIFGHENHPIPVGIGFTSKEKTFGFKGVDYNGFKFIANFNINKPLESKFHLFLAESSGEFDLFEFAFPDIEDLINDILGIKQVADWLDKPILPGNINTKGLGSILVAFNLLAKDANDVYSLGDIGEIKNITFAKIIATALQLLDGLQLLKLGEDGKEGLFISSADVTGGKAYGFRFVLTDFELTGRGKEKENNDAPAPAAAPPAEGGKAEKKPNRLLLQIGKVFEKDPVAEAEGEESGDGSETDSTVVLLAEAEDKEDNWTNSKEPLGINLDLVTVATDDTLTFTPRLALISVGIDYKSGDDDTPLATGGGFSFTGIEPRAYLTLAPEQGGGADFEFGAAIRVDHIELPLDAGIGKDSKKDNPVVANLLDSKSGDKEGADAGAGDGEATGDGEKTTPPVRTKFSFAAGYTPVAGATQHHLNIFLYDAKNERTTKPIWWKVEKSFGPVLLQKIGISWDNAPRDLGLYLSGGLVTSGLKIELEELSVTMPLTDMSKTKLGLKGLNLYFKGGPVELSGAFLEVDGPGGSKQYDGEAELKAGTFGISAMGSYGSVSTKVNGVTENHASLFIFALLDVPLGGPPFFFVTGLAAGFGYNRDLKIPTLDNLPTFPLVSAAMAGQGGGSPFGGSADPGSALKVLAEYIPPSYGEYWLGLGVRFTSFELVQSFALLTVAFGTRFEIDLLGLSAISMPPALPEGDEPIAFAELALDLTIQPDTGIFGLSAKLTDQSYILSKDCHITGGFAFFIWGKDKPGGGADDYKAGDFVVTLGGYNAHYTKPKFFPEEPRVGINWVVSPEFTIKGGLYFALTPSAVMAGGSLSAVWQSGAVRAWFEVYADFLLSWKPFFYYIDAGISLGLSLKIDILFIHTTITLSLGVQIALWGPSFGGKAKVDLAIISFTIHFGSSKPKKQPIGWGAFKDSFLPPPQADDGGTNTPEKRALPMVLLMHLAVLDTPSPKQIPTNTICFVRPGANGLVKDLSKEKGNNTGLDYILKPEGFSLITHTSFPTMTAFFCTGNGDADNPAEKSINLIKTLSLTPTSVDIGPSSIPAADLKSVHNISLYKLDGEKHDLAFDFSAHGAEEPVWTNSPTATWNNDAAQNPSLTNANDKPLNISGTLSGFTILGKLKPPDQTMPVDMSALQYEVAPTEPSFSWSNPKLKTTDPDPGADGTQELMKTVNDPTVNARRAGILAKLNGGGLLANTTVEVSQMAKSAGNVLLDAPQLMEWTAE
jgi:hypothetical protein